MDNDWYECFVFPLHFLYAPATFQSRMNNVLHELLDVCGIADVTVIGQARVESGDGSSAQQ